MLVAQIALIEGDAKPLLRLEQRVSLLRQAGMLALDLKDRRFDSPYLGTHGVLCREVREECAGVDEDALHGFVSLRGCCGKNSSDARGPSDLDFHRVLTSGPPPRPSGFRSTPATRAARRRARAAACCAPRASRGQRIDGWRPSSRKVRASPRCAPRSLPARGGEAPRTRAG